MRLRARYDLDGGLTLRDNKFAKPTHYRIKADAASPS
jgi:hypothetical protein